MPPATSSATTCVAVLSAERRMRTALCALLETDHRYSVYAAATPEMAQDLLHTTRPAAIVVGLGSADGTSDRVLLRLAREVDSITTIVVGSGDGFDLDTGPDAILAAVCRAIDSTTS